MLLAVPVLVAGLAACGSSKAGTKTAAGPHPATPQAPSTTTTTQAPSTTATTQAPTAAPPATPPPTPSHNEVLSHDEALGAWAIAAKATVTEIQTLDSQTADAYSPQAADAYARAAQMMEAVPRSPDSGINDAWSQLAADLARLATEIRTTGCPYEPPAAGATEPHTHCDDTLATAQADGKKLTAALKNAGLSE
jgi:hypothetical protein